MLLAGVAVLATFRAFGDRIPDDAAVRELDRREGADGRWIAAWELVQRAERDPFAAAAIADAAPSLARVPDAVRTRFPVRWPAVTSRALVLLALAPVAHGVLAGQGPWWRPAPAQPIAREDALAIEGERLQAIAERLELPTMAWAVKETRRWLEPLRAAKPRPVEPKAVAVPVPTRGATITDPEARAFFEQVLSGATSASVAREITEQFTELAAPAAYAQLAAEFKTRGVAPGSKYDLAPDAGGGNVTLPKDAGGGSGGLGPKVDPSKMKSDYLPDKEDMGAELASALKESFDEYLRQFASELLRGMEDALEQKLSGKPDGTGKSALANLPDSPRGMAEARDAHAGPRPDGPRMQAKEGGAAVAGLAAGSEALGGTAAGGSGAGAGAPGAKQTDGGDAAAAASGQRLDLAGSLDQRLAVVEVVRRMSGGTGATDDTASAEVVLKTTRAAEKAATTSEDVPDEWREAVERYFRALGGPDAAGAVPDGRTRKRSQENGS